MRPLVIDIHTHIYTPRLVQLLRSRIVNPRIHNVKGKEKLAILPEEVDGGRPIGPQYYDRKQKIDFMNRHGIDASVISIANPWLDFLSPLEAIQAATEANADLVEWCKDDSSEHEPIASSTSSGFKSALPSSSRIRAFGILPFCQGIKTSDLVSTLQAISKSAYLKGAIIGTRGNGKGLDDPDLDPLWRSAEHLKQPLFLHPHYGIGADSIKEEGIFGSRNNGHVLPLAIGFPVETASAATRMILAGIFDRYPALQIILAHSGGALPLLSSRLASCISHDPLVADRLQHDARYYLGKFYYDAVCYGSEELEFVAKVVGRSHRYKHSGKRFQINGVSQEEEMKLGASRFMLGSDHPFFPPPKTETSVSPLWTSFTSNLDALESASSFHPNDKIKIRGQTAATMFNIAV